MIVVGASVREQTLPYQPVQVRKRVRFQGDQHDDQKMSAEPQSLTETAVSTPQTGTDSEHSDTDDEPSVKPRRPSLRP